MCLHELLIIKHEHEAPAAPFSPLPALQEEALAILKRFFFLLGAPGLAGVLSPCNNLDESFHSSSFFHFCPSSNTWLFPSIPAQAIIESFRVRSGGQGLTLDLVGCSRTLCPPNLSAALAKLAAPRSYSTSRI